MPNSMELITAMGSLVRQAAEQDIMAANEQSLPHGLSLTAAEVTALMDTRDEVLENAGRVELGENILRRLIDIFCDSPYIQDWEYTDTLAALMVIFFEMKNRTHDKLSDDAILDGMKAYFDGVCNGSLTLLMDNMDSLAGELREMFDLDEYDMPEMME